MEVSVIGIDPGLNHVGLAAIGEEGFFITQLIEPNQKLDRPSKYQQIQDEIREFMTRADVSIERDLKYVVIEMPSRVYNQGRKVGWAALFSYTMAVGAIEMAVIGVSRYPEIVEIDAPSWIAPGLATKERARVYLKSQGYPVDGLSDHEIDAALLADWWIERCLIEGNCSLKKKSGKKTKRKKSKRR